MPHSHRAYVRQGADIPGRIELTYSITVNSVKGAEKTYRFTALVPDDSTDEELAAALGQVASRTFLKTLKDQ